MSTVGNILERLYRQFLYPPDREPAMVFTTDEVDDSTDPVVISIGEFHNPEDEELLRLGVAVELDQEILRTVDHDSLNQQVTAKRAQMGTTAATHPSGSTMILAPSFPRISAFEAVRDNLIALSPKLYQVSQEYVVPITMGVGPIEDPLAVSVASITPDSLAWETEVHGEIVDFHPAVGGRALVTNVQAGTAWVRFRRRMGIPESESDELGDLGVELVWEFLITIGAAADMLVGRDPSEVNADYIGSLLEAENIRIGTRTQLAGALSQYRQLLLERFSDEMDNEYPITAHMNDPRRIRVRGGMG